MQEDQFQLSLKFQLALEELHAVISKQLHPHSDTLRIRGLMGSLFERWLNSGRNQPFEMPEELQDIIQVDVNSGESSLLKVIKAIGVMHTLHAERMSPGEVINPADFIGRIDWRNPHIRRWLPHFVIKYPTVVEEAVRLGWVFNHIDAYAFTDQSCFRVVQNKEHWDKSASFLLVPAGSKSPIQLMDLSYPQHQDSINYKFRNNGLSCELVEQILRICKPSEISSQTSFCVGKCIKKFKTLFMPGDIVLAYHAMSDDHAGDRVISPRICHIEYYLNSSGLKSYSPDPGCFPSHFEVFAKDSIGKEKAC